MVKDATDIEPAGTWIVEREKSKQPDSV